MLSKIKRHPLVQNFLYERYWNRLIKIGRQNKRNTNKQMTEPIDFVVTWVDGNDPEWIKSKETYEQSKGIAPKCKDNGEERYRDWDMFQYWFRAVEKYAPWVRNIYLVTCGQVPPWVDLHNPKIHLIAHSDIMEADALPTFNASAIESCLHKIEGLSEHFVYFNDDIFLSRPSLPEDFFRGGLPNYSAIASPIKNISNSAFDHMRFTALGASDNPIIIIMGPITIGGNSLSTHDFPNFLIKNENKT